MSESQQPIITFDRVRKQFDAQTVIGELSFEVYRGELLVLVGTSGSGKTTTLRMINRLGPQDQGVIYYDQQDITTLPLSTLRWNLGYVVQQIALFPTMTVAENIRVIPEMKGEHGPALAAKVDDLLSSVGLDPQAYRDRMPAELSGGEQQRIGILRAIASAPEVVLMDEPFSALDPISRTQLQDLVIDLHQRLHNTIIFVTHDMDEALRLGDRIAVMRQGQIVQLATPAAIAQHPANAFVAEFFQSSLAKDLYQVYLSRILMQGYGSANTPATTVTALPGTATLRAAFAQLGQTGAGALQVTGLPDGKDQFLTTQRLFAYLADHELGDTDRQGGQ